MNQLPTSKHTRSKHVFKIYGKKRLNWAGGWIFLIAWVWNHFEWCHGLLYVILPNEHLRAGPLVDLLKGYGLFVHLEKKKPGNMKYWKHVFYFIFLTWWFYPGFQSWFFRVYHQISIEPPQDIITVDPKYQQYYEHQQVTSLTSLKQTKFIQPLQNQSTPYSILVLKILNAHTVDTPPVIWYIRFFSGRAVSYNFPWKF